MNDVAALKAAAFAIAAKKGYNEAISELSTLITELQNLQWNGK